jgi:signal transduction histidine kinase
MELDYEASLNVAIGLLQLALAAVVFRHLARIGRAIPWLVALMVFFALRGADRLYVAFAGDEPFALTVVLDAVVLGVLVLLVIGLETTVRGLRTTVDDAERRTAEYERALADYRILARHRLANPLAAIRGGIQTLRETPVDTAARDELLTMIDAEAQRLAEVALDPDPSAPEELRLRPRPEAPKGRNAAG